MHVLTMRLLVGGALVLFLATAVQAQGPTVVADTYIQSGANSAQNFGALANILVGPGGSAATQNKGLIQFDLSGLTGVLASNVEKATLWVYVNRVTTAGSIDVYDVTTAWFESTVTWNTTLVPGGNLGTIPVSAASQWVGLDITTEVQTWLATPSLDHGVELVAAAAAPSTAVSLDAKENTNTSHPAQLQIVLNGPAGATGASGPSGATGATGPSGPSGPAGFITAYASTTLRTVSSNNGSAAFVATGTAQTVAPGSPFSFNSHVVNGSLTLTGSNTFHVNSAGTYLATYGASSNITSTRTIALKVNGSVNAMSAINIASASSAPQFIGNQIVLNLSSNDTVQLVNHGASPITTGSHHNVASLTLVRLQ